MGYYLFAIASAVLIFYLLTERRYRWFYIFYKTIGRDVRACSRFFKLNFILWRSEKTNKTVPKVFSELVLKHPDKVAFYFEDETWTFQDVEDFSNQIARFYKKEGFRRGDTIALLLESRPEYVCIWLGLAKIGVVTALINNNLVTDPLIHSLKVGDAKAIIFGSDFSQSVADISSKIKRLKLYQFNKTLTDSVLENAIDLSTKLKSESSANVAEEVRRGNSKDKLIYIYTSGTTGLPKAAVITNLRFLFMALGLNSMTLLTENDVLYDPLPLYHSAGGMVGVGQCLLKGITVAIRKKFSASNFWKDCLKYNCTAAQYIGEICRYILAANKSAPQHKVRKMLGNGLRPQIWEKFTNRFGVKEVYEFYGATEGNSNLINIDNTVGAVGFVPRYARLIYPVTLVRCNEETGEPTRNGHGFCVPCQPGEPGVFIGVINPNKTVNDFTGYADKEATAKKLIENVFRKGDLYFNSGDILVQDELGYFFFKDRTGDTFRWKGENVATSEIEAVISNLANFSDAVVYGVEIPGNEGRAGMVAIVDTSKNLDIENLSRGLKQNLPSYAIPIFVRVMDAVPLTGTFKLKKTDLQKDGFNINKIEDQIFIYDLTKSVHIPLTQEKYKELMAGNIRL